MADTETNNLAEEQRLDSQKARRHSDIRVFSGTATPKVAEVAPEEDAPICWICLDVGRADTALMRPCNCPRYAHAGCLARWQLQSAGSRRETHCEFCDCTLPEWKSTLTPVCGANAPAVMNVNFDGQTYSFEVKPGSAGYKQFTQAIREAFSLPEDSLIHAGSLLTLQGAGAYDAAVHCASVSAARRILQQQQNPDGTLPQSMHSIQGQRHYDATQPIPVQVPPPGTSTTPAGSSGQSSSSAQQASNGMPRSSSSNSNNRSRKRWTGITRRMRTAFCEMWTPNNSRPNEEQSGQE
ncbi:MAG: zygote specific ZYS1 [Trebouxia sp. A1-2]|nr:MAG: zygote specific ZYS1 [Trebouxia sp. A1-2]